MLYFFFFITVSSCTKHFVSTQYTFQEQQLNATYLTDKTVEDIIRPYKDSLEKAMNVILCISDTILTKSSPESDLGNMMCDFVLKKSRDYCNCSVDFTILNNGGIRIPNLPNGNITLGKIFELMPFDNLINIIEVNTKTIDTLFNHIAKMGGWQVSGASYKIKEDKAVEIHIQNQPLDSAKTYSLAISDYLAQGGDNCTMLLHLRKRIMPKTIRDALVDGMKEMNMNGEHLKSVIDGRIEKLD